MDKFQAFQSWIGSFVNGKAYLQNDVPDNAGFPRITYSLPVGEFDSFVMMADASIWDQSNSWKNILLKTDEIYEAVGLGGILIPYNDGKIWVKRGVPFSQPMDDEDITIRRILLSFEIEYLTAR